MKCKSEKLFDEGDEYSKLSRISGRVRQFKVVRASGRYMTTSCEDHFRTISHLRFANFNGGLKVPT